MALDSSASPLAPTLRLPKSLLRRLPPELRNQIYLYVILDTLWPSVQNPSTNLFPAPIIYRRSALRLPLYKTDPLIHSEASSLLFSTYAFNFGDLAIIEQLHPTERARIKNAGVRITTRVLPIQTYRVVSWDESKKCGKRWLNSLRGSIKKLITLLPQLQVLKLHLDLDPWVSEDKDNHAMRAGIVDCLKPLETLVDVWVRFERQRLPKLAELINKNTHQGIKADGEFYTFEQNWVVYDAAEYEHQRYLQQGYGWPEGQNKPALGQRHHRVAAQ